MADGAPSGASDVFLSYASEDEARARELATALDQRGFSVFWDREVPPGQTWHSYIGEALANAGCVVVAWSRHSVASQWVIEEANEGKDRNVLVPVLFETVPLPFGFRGLQAANLSDWRLGQSSRSFDSLAGAVQRVISGQAGLGTAAEAESPAAQKSKPSVRPATPSRVSSEPRAEPVRPANGRAGAWSGPKVMAMVFVALAGAGAGLWWLIEPRERTAPVVLERWADPPKTAAPAPAQSSRAGTCCVYSLGWCKPWGSTPRGSDSPAELGSPCYCQDYAGVVGQDCQ